MKGNKAIKILKTNYWVMIVKHSKWVRVNQRFACVSLLNFFCIKCCAEVISEKKNEYI